MKRYFFRVLAILTFCLLAAACGENKKAASTGRDNPMTAQKEKIAFGTEALPVSYFDTFTYDLPPLPTGITEQVEYYETQAANWNKIISDLKEYILANSVIFVYTEPELTYTAIHDDYNNRNVVQFLIMAVLAVPNLETLSNVESVLKVWESVSNTDTGNMWRGKVKSLWEGSRGDVLLWHKDVVNSPVENDLGWKVEIGLYDSTGKRLAVYSSGGVFSVGFSDSAMGFLKFGRIRQSDGNSGSFSHSRGGFFIDVPIGDITDESSFTSKIDSFDFSEKWLDPVNEEWWPKVKMPPLMSYEEYKQEYHDFLESYLMYF
jgi:hypothetical protein